MAFTHGRLLEALQLAIKAGIPQHVLDVGGAATGGIAAMLAAQAGAERVILYEPFKVRAAVVKDIVAANGFGKEVKIVEQDLLAQPKPVPMQRKNPADMLVLDVASHFGSDLLNSTLLPTITHARDNGFLTPDVTVVPARVHLVVCLIESLALAEMEEIRQTVEGCDVSEFNKFSRDTRRVQVPHLIASYLILSHLSSPLLFSSHLVASHCIASRLISSHLNFTYLISSHRISSHLISSNLA